MDKIAVLIPCYNEEKTIGKVVSDLKKVLPKECSRVYVYDNNSTDNTVREAEKYGAEVGGCLLQGKGATVRKMLSEIDADVYLMIDGDDTYEVGYANYLIKEVLSGRCDMAIGDRLSTNYNKVNKRIFHSFGNRLVCKIINKRFNSSIPDTLTGYRAFNRKIAKGFIGKFNGFEIETEMTIFALKNGLAIHSIPISYRSRPSGSISKLNTIEDGLSILHAIKELG